MFSHSGNEKNETHRMCGKFVENELFNLRFVPDHLKTQGMCEGVVKRVSWMIEYVPSHLKTQTMCERAVKDKPDNLCS